MLFVQDQYQYLVTKSMTQEHYLVSQFENKEYLLKLESLVQGQKCIVVGSLTAPAEQVLQLLLLLHSLREQGALQVILFAPYLGYQRQDSFEIKTCCGLQWADSMLFAAGVDQIITLETHCPSFLPLLKVPVIVHNSSIFFEEEMTYFIAAGFGFIFPDAGAVARSSWILEKFPQVNYGHFQKNRVHGVVQFEKFQGKVGRKVMIVDDIVDSGQTLVQLCIILRQLGVEEIVVFVTHAFFHGQAWNDLWSLGVKLLFCTNSLPKSDQVRHPQIQCKFINFLLQKYL
ncbi:ribose-phosphate pyrophosphokinase [Candidatus Babeliales bacterium]|nr:ribose-phosphate pyrophosphokinase [Candidatus Babeliales bacterium]MBP9843468.1 ribose-phosphate pyrophosphokinase [Candidatus Babeliales bacterium]